MLNELLMIPAAFAQGAAAKGPSLMEQMVLPVALIFVMYFLLIRPQQRKAKEHNNLIQGLKPGDEVVTNGGIIGRIKSVSDTFVSVDVSSSTTLKVLKTHIAGLTKPKDAKDLTASPVKAK